MTQADLTLLRVHELIDDEPAPLDPQGHEATAPRIGGAWQDATEWHLRWPPL